MKTIKALFWNADQRRLRAGWRLLIQLCLFFILLIGLALGTNALGPSARLIGPPVYLLMGLGLAWCMARFIDGRPMADYGLHLNRNWWIDLGFGFALGSILITGVLLTEIALGWVSVTGMAATSSTLPFGLAFLFSLMTQIAVGVNEELTFRGYQLKNLSEGLVGNRFSPRTAIVLAFLISSTLFGLAHLSNVGATTLSTLNLILAGLALALPYMLTGELGISIGLHISWNFFQGAVYGFAVSGSLPTTHLLILQQSGPDLWTGGDFGPEAGLLSAIWTVIGCGLTVWWIGHRHKQVRLYLPLAHYEVADQAVQMSRSE